MGGEKENGSMLIRILSNRDIQLGFSFLVLALILAFVGALSEVRTSTPDQDILQGSSEHQWREVSRSYTAINTSIVLNYTSENSNDTVEIWFEEGYPYENESKTIEIPTEEGSKDNITMEPGENLTFDLQTLETFPRTVNFNLTSGELKYEHNLVYQTKPYGLLSFPALLFLFIGMVFAFKGKGVIAAEIQKKKEREKEESQKSSQKEKGEPEEEFEEVEKEDVVYPGPEKGRRDEAEHVDFMGLSESSKEDEEDKE